MTKDIVPIVDPSLKDPLIKTKFVEANGLRFEVDYCGTGPKLMLCLHGFPEHSFSWRYQLPMLADMGYTVWAPNMRGYGLSSRPLRVADYRMEELIEDVYGLYEASGCSSLTILAHDWGAVIAWQYAMLKRSDLDHLIICNVPHPAAMQENFDRNQLKKSWYVFFFQIPWLPEYSMGRREAEPIATMLRNSNSKPEMFPDEVINVYRKNAAQPRALNAMVNYYRALLRYGRRKYKTLSEFPIIDTPTLMVWGEEDVALSKKTTLNTDRYVSNLTLKYLPGVSHWVQQEAPDQVNNLIKEFLG